MREPPRIVRFGVFEADLTAGELRRRGMRVDLQEQPFQILRLLLERPGEVVRREELQTAIWPSDTFVEFDRSINTAIKKVRDALGDSAASPVFIETLPRKGYRFIAPVSDKPDTSHAVRERSEQRKARLAIGGAVVGLSLLAPIVWLTTGTSGDGGVSAVPLTSYPGEESEPSFSPDETRVAFVWNGPSQDNYDVYVKQIGTDRPVRLTTDAAQDFGPAWSPDGRWIAFGRVSGGGDTVEVMVIPAIGGAERRITTAAAPHVNDARPFLAWVPDSQSLVISDTSKGARAPSGAGPLRATRVLLQVSIDSGERRQITFPSTADQGDGAPAFSPDGGTLAFVRETTISVRDLYSIGVASAMAGKGEPRRITRLQQHVSNPMWLPRGEEIAFAAGTFAGSTSLFRLRIRGDGERPRVALSGQQVGSAALSTGGRLAYEQQGSDTNIWRLGLKANGVPSGKPKRWIASTWTDAHPVFSPDGKRIAFLSDRDGRKGLWVAGEDGLEAAPLLSTEARVGAPSWSPDGEWILFDSNRGGNWEVYRIRASGGATENLTTHPATDCCASYSAGARWVYFVSTRNGRPQLWKLLGGGKAVALTENGGYGAIESRDGRFVYYSIPDGKMDRRGSHRLMRVPASGGEEAMVLPSVTFYNFAVAEEGIYYIPGAKPGEPYFIQFHPFATGRDREVLQLLAEPTVGLTLSPNGSSLLYTQIDERKSDLMLVDRLD